MVKHQKTLIRTGLIPELPWDVGCSCGWADHAVDEKHASKVHRAHRAASQPFYRLSRPLAGGVVFVSFVPPINGDWGYTMDPAFALAVDEKTRKRYLRHMRAVGLKGSAILVQT